MRNLPVEKLVEWMAKGKSQRQRAEMQGAQYGISDS